MVDILVWYCGSVSYQDWSLIRLLCQSVSQCERKYLLSRGPPLSPIPDRLQTFQFLQDPGIHLPHHLLHKHNSYGDITHPCCINQHFFYSYFIMKIEEIVQNDGNVQYCVNEFLMMQLMLSSVYICRFSESHNQSKNITNVCHESLMGDRGTHYNNQETFDHNILWSNKFSMAIDIYRWIGWKAR